ncbi:MAG: TetR/AcrR family transcriptional regulator [Bacteroidota bacterium]|nr:TetR/AcrR family transcriptional regulator [Bacteroidota bacterium]
MPRTEEQYEKIREQKKVLIMETALELFATHGYYPTSISMIAKKAGISKGLSYNYFKSKEDLVREIMVKGFEAFIESFDTNKDGILTCEEFEFFVRDTFRVLQENIPYWKLYFSTMMQPQVFDLIQKEVYEMLPKYTKMLMVYYDKQGVEHPAQEALIFGAVMDGISLNYVMNPDHFPIEKSIQSIIDKFGHCKK